MGFAVLLVIFRVVLSDTVQFIYVKYLCCNYKQGPGVNIFPNVHAFCVGIVSKYLGLSFKEAEEPLNILVESVIKVFRILISAKTFSNVVFLDKEFQNRL